jgi:hypothetical protein
VNPRVTSLGVFLVALLPRLYAAIAWTREPVWDGHYYDIGARSIAEGLGYVGTSGGAWCHYPVGYSGLIGGVYALFGPGRFVGPITNAVMGALLAVLTHRLARRATSERRALVAALIVALYPGLIAYTPLLMTEPAASLALLGAAVVGAAYGHRRRGIFAAALLLGLGVLIRPQSLLCAPLLALLPAGALHRRRDGEDGDLRSRLLDLGKAASVATLVTVAVVLPWTARNCVVMDGCAFVSTNGGWNLAIGAFPRATGRFASLRGSDGCRIVTGQVQQDRCWMRLGLGWIADDPGRWLGLMDDKLGYTFDHESFPIGYLGEADPDAWPDSKKRWGRGLLSWTHRALLTMAAFGVVPPPSRRRPATLLAALTILLLAFYAAATPSHPFWPLAVALPLIALVRWRRLTPAQLFAAGAIGTVAITHAVFFGEDRYHMVVTPLLALLAACAFSDDEPAQRPALGDPPSPS